MSLFDIYKTKSLGKGAGSLFDAKVGSKLSNAWKKGFNIWDEEWEVGAIVSGNNYASTTNMRSKNYVPCLPSTKYRMTCPVKTVVFEYDSNKSVITLQPGSNIKYIDVKANTTFTTHADARYLRFYTNEKSYGTTYQNDICINISGEHDGEYVPYDGE